MMIIKTTKDLNDFIVKSGISEPEKILAKLEETKQLISPNMAKLILSKAA